MTRLVTPVFVAFILSTACQTADSEVAPSGSGTNSTMTATQPAEENAAAGVFIRAWSRADAATMRQVAAQEAVDVALRLGRAEGSPKCSSQPSGQYQCIVSLASGDRAYILAGEPGDPTGRVWWVGQYHPDS